MHSLRRSTYGAMRRPRAALLAALLPASMMSMVAASAAAQAPACPAPPVALVLSGGGARGLAHIGVLRTLERRGIRPALVVGTSIGAIIGGLWASGHSAAEIDSIVHAFPLARLFSRFDPRRPQVFGGLQPLVTWARGPRGFALASNGVREETINAFLAALLLRGNLFARGDFDRLPIPFRAVATRLADRRPVVLGSGDLAQAVRASAAIPLVLAPETVDHAQLVDGGLAANVPVRSARDALGGGSGRLIISDVSHGLADSTDLVSPLRIAGQLLSFLTTQPGDTVAPGDVYIRPALGVHRMLDFAPEKIDALEAAGGAAADSALGATACEPDPSNGRPRRSPSLPTHVGRIAVVANLGVDSARLLRFLGLAPGESLDVAGLRTRLLGFAETSPYAAIWLTPSGRADTVDFAIDGRLRPPAQVGLGAAYDYDLGGRLWVGTLDRQPLGGRFMAWALLAAARFDQTARLGLQRPFTVAGRALSILLTLRGTHERVRTFDTAGHELAPLGTRELVAVLGTEHGLGHDWEAGLGVEARVWHDPMGNRSAAGVRLRLQQVDASGDPRLGVEASLADAYQRVVATGKLTALHLARGRLALAPLLRYQWGHHLPLQMTVPLGGLDGFPGLHLGEHRGSRELITGLEARVALSGGVFALVEGMGGTTDREGDALPDAPWLWGARAGLGTDTPAGVLRIAYGRNSLHRGVVYVRVGRWF
ncbi:MAG TPA: patatin-like phospholipase family protein [Gemmatimonadales bacterium]|nr:patatin-like phospholipase family protein [Gemmatimonadales bacterium]